MPDAVAAPAIATSPGSPATPTPATPVAADPGAWRSSLSPEYATAKSLEKFTTPNDLAKSYLEQEKLLLSPKLPAPQPTWDDKAWGDFYDKAGRPKDAKGYEFQPLENLPAGLTAAPEQDEWFANAAHAAGLNKTQANKLRDAFVGFQAERAQGSVQAQEAAAKAREAGITKLQAQYGPKWDAAIDGAQRMVNQYGSQEFKDLMKSSGLDSHPAILDFMAKLGTVVTDHQVLRGIPGNSFGMGAAGAQAEITRMNADPNIQKILTDSRHPQHDQMMRTREELYKKAIPS